MFVFKDSPYRDSVLKTREFMFSDLKAAVSLAQSKGSAPNFLLALGLCCYTEFWGRLVQGVPSGNEEICFDAFFTRLGKCYRSQRQHMNGVMAKMEKDERMGQMMKQSMDLLPPGAKFIVGDFERLSV